jgi:hypothetical protein
MFLHPCHISADTTSVHKDANFYFLFSASALRERGRELCPHGRKK